MTDSLRELKKSVEVLKKEQTQIRIDTLKLTAEELRRKETDQKIDELRRDVESLRHRLPLPPGGVVPPPKNRRELPPPQPGKALLEMPADAVAHITVRLPADARLTVHGVDCPLTSDTRTFDTPALTPGQEYYYLLEVVVVRDGRTIAQSRRIDFRSGARVTVSFENLEANLASAR
ncbi:MAG TPA: TIGR03000 domain-containing protein [Gemmataceae bacterium]|nr:TIGR03000 domain-containing protein [Gemmataceae bacterium]